MKMESVIINKPTVLSVNFMYVESKKVFSIFFTIKTTHKLEYITIDSGKNYDQMLKYAQELATLIEVDFVNEGMVSVD